MVWTTKAENKSLNKNTRWDRIRKKHTNDSNMKTNLVKKFIEMDFIGKNNMNILNGCINMKQNLNPALVMDLRHEMFQKKREKVLYTKKYKTNTDKCIVHNIEVEDHYIQKELKKFREKLEKNRQQCKIRKSIIDSDDFKLNNTEILKSLENTTRKIEDFYQLPLKAMKKFDNYLEDQKTFKIEFETESCEKTSPSLYFHDQKENIEMRCVRFENTVDIVKYNREESLCSNTSNGIDSVISDLADEVLNKIGFDNAEDKVNLDIHIRGLSLENNNSTDPLIVTKIIREQNEQIDSDADVPSLLTDENEESVSNEQTAIIQKLFKPKSDLNSHLLRNYFLKWVHYTTLQKIERQNCTHHHDRIHKINDFLDHLRKKKKNQSTVNVTRSSGESKLENINVSKKYKSKIKIQQDIIDLQRIKLERQERLITELKLNKLSEEAKEAREEIKKELKNALRTGDLKTRAKAKCLQIMGNLRDDEDNEFARLQGKALTQPKFLTNMQERALVRSIKHEQAKQRRLQQEAEREAAKLAAEEAKRLEDEEAKQTRMEILIEKRRQEKMAKIIKERERQRLIENNKKAKEFCRRLLLRRIGMEGFKRLLQMKRENYKKADNFKKNLIKKNVFYAWKNHCLLIFERKKYLANQLYEKIVMRNALNMWISFWREQKSKYLVAVDWYELKLSQAVFNQWCGYAKLQKLEEDRKMKQAELHHEWHLKWKVIDCWQRLPQILKLEKETDERRQRWRMKIWELLPDYTPNRDSI